ncbi:hypothetical protein JAAARDRAFT_310037 [Jaapia argillacea MUCL 33604]|uniref:Uncharacterized protein n=1 Tax=Jaapia argillacea MUCL 33604 TaxID=933084 RepID=A0A067PYJ7_9AGAM|nr:hypothetical protein JAAARDRAFT_310037 [Jaapia argillacea MUCL 33604]
MTFIKSVDQDSTGLPRNPHFLEEIYWSPGTLSTLFAFGFINQICSSLLLLQFVVYSVSSFRRLTLRQPPGTFPPHTERHDHQLKLLKFEIYAITSSNNDQVTAPPTPFSVSRRILPSPNNAGTHR